MLALYIHNPSMYIQNRVYSLNGRNTVKIAVIIVWACIIKKHKSSDKYEND